MIGIGDIVRTSYGTGPYRVRSISGPHTRPSYHDTINLDDPPPSRPHYSMTVIPVRIPPGHERPSDYCYLSGYEPTEDPRIWRSVWNDDCLFIEGHAPGTQLPLF